MSRHPGQTEDGWERGWDGHEKAQLLRMARLSFEEKIKWLEEAQEVIQAMQRQKGFSHTPEDP